MAQAVVLLKLGRELLGPVGEALPVEANQHILILRAAPGGADLNVLHDLEGGVDAGNLARGRCQPLHDLGCARQPLGLGLQGEGEMRDIQRRVRGAGADHGHDAEYVWVLADHLLDRGLQRLHALERYVRRGHGIGGEKAGILIRQEAFRDGEVQHNRQDQGERRHDQRRSSGTAAQYRA